MRLPRSSSTTSPACAPRDPDVHHLSRVLAPSSRRDRRRIRRPRFMAAVHVTRVRRPGSSRQETFARLQRAARGVTVAFAPVKGDRPEWVVQKLAEIGVDRVVVLRAARSVVLWDGARADRAIERLSKVAEQAAAQSRRAWIPAVEGVTSLLDFARAGPVVLAERGGGADRGRVRRCASGPKGAGPKRSSPSLRGWSGSATGCFAPRRRPSLPARSVCALRDRGCSQ